MKSAFFFILSIFLFLSICTLYKWSTSPQKPRVSKLSQPPAPQKISKSKQKALTAPAKPESGVDSEVFLAIQRRYAHQPDHLRIALRSAEALQSVLLVSSDNNEREVVRRNISKFAACRALKLSGADGLEMGRFLEDLLFQNDTDAETYIQWNASWNGQIIDVIAPKEDVCDS